MKVDDFVSQARARLLEFQRRFKRLAKANGTNPDKTIPEWIAAFNQTEEWRSGEIQLNRQVAAFADTKPSTEPGGDA